MRTLCVLFVNGLSAFTANSPCQLYIFWHDRDTFGVNGAQIRVFEQAYQVSFRRFLKGTYSGALKAQIGLEILCDFTNQTLERQFPDEQLRGLLVSSDFSQSYSTGPEKKIQNKQKHSHKKKKLFKSSFKDIKFYLKQVYST
ncbi:hypothetical protein ALC56_09461 [Trachymyrmex septentrionalis]|uniref:Uncharacterized protein n=1 Tax=Trachymyrmex septentrionalis TaxID=34720 RepID=A0A151JUS3_9HYME|nr:hypothetical protein ALC56_09461 [Trachymyrmex septentrionalis]